MGFKNKCLFDRHAVGGEYGAAYKTVGKGTLVTTFIPEGTESDPTKAILVDKRKLADKVSAAVVYDNPYDNVTAMAHHFFSRCLDEKVTPYVVTKKTVFKWQETFWSQMKMVYDEHYKAKFVAKNLCKASNGELVHFLSDVATMQVW